MLDDSEFLFTVTDLKQYLYCPRIFYYHACLPRVRPVTYKMRAGIDAHENERRKAARRTLGAYAVADGERQFDVAVSSAHLGLNGVIDEVVISTDEIIPVDYKLARRDGTHFRVQLAAYGLMLEEVTGHTVKRGYLYLIPVRKSIEVAITQSLRAKAEAAVAEMHHIAMTESMPGPTHERRKCLDCEFRRLCNDV